MKLYVCLFIIGLNIFIFQNCSGIQSKNSMSSSIASSTTTRDVTLISVLEDNQTEELKQQPESRCEKDWVLVPGDPDLGTSDFCIMKFEAQNSNSEFFSLRERTSSEPLEPRFIVDQKYINSEPQSSFSSANKNERPWVYVTQKQAKAACQKINAHLTTVFEAQTISRNLFLQPLNWDSNHVGQGCMYGGHLDLNPSQPLAVPVTEQSLDDHYKYTNDSVVQAPQKDMGKCFTRSRIINGSMKVHKNGWLSRRTMVLSNNQFLWDWSGNVSEWLAEKCTNNGLGNGEEAVFANQSNGYGFFDYNKADHPGSTEPGRPAPVYTEWTQHYLFDYENLVHGPRNPKIPGSELMSSNQGVGMYQGCRINGNAIYRGGAAYHGPEGGIFQTHMDHTVQFNHAYIGFRCEKKAKP